ncbi:MAG: phytanoyl-CoA dioxygenase family protein [bacterium]|nr:phytanoyl-CoA dioxygenase family protein [bacterium]
MSPNTSPHPTIENASETFNRDGYLIVKNLYTPEQMLNWKTRVIHLLEQEGSLNNLPSGVRVWMADALEPYLLECMKDPRVVSILNQIIGPHVEFLSVKAVYKNKTTTFGTPWHQDWYYWKGTNKISIWIALDNATPENGCLKMIPGSHHKKYKVKQIKAEHGFTWRINLEEFADQEDVTLSVNQGDAVFFHDQTLHASYPNTAGTDRWSFISTYRDASVKDEATTWKTPLLLSGSSVNISS